MADRVRITLYYTKEGKQAGFEICSKYLHFGSDTESHGFAMDIAKLVVERANMEVHIESRTVKT